MIKKALLALLVVMLTVGPAFAAEKITIEAEGSGTTKMEALKAAWMEAVRNAVGMSMTGSTQLTDDKIAETIATYSRGHVNSYQILSESQSNNLWTVRIRADIDRDELQGSAKTSTSQTIDLTQSNEAAAALSAYEAKKDGVEMFLSTVNATDWSSFIDYSLSIKTINNKLWLFHRCKINFENYFKFSNNLAKILEIIAVETRTVPIGDYLNNEIRDLNEFYNSNNITYDKEVLSKFSNHNEEYSLTEVVSPFHVNEENEIFDIYVVTSVNEMKIFKLEKSDLDKIIQCLKSFNIVFTVNAGGEGSNSVIANASKNIHLLFYEFGNIVRITPTFGMCLKPNSMYFNTLQELKLTNEQINNIKTLNGKFTLEQLRYTNDLDWKG